MPDKKIDLMLVIDMSTTEDYRGRRLGRFRVTVGAVRQDAGYNDPPFRYLSAWDSPWAGWEGQAVYGDFTYGDGRPFGWQAGFRPGSGIMELAEAERFAKQTLRYVKNHTKACAAYGSPSGLGQEVIYLMKACGITQAAWRLPAGRTGVLHRDYRVTADTACIQAHIDGAVEDFRAEHRPAPAAVA